MGTGAFAGRHRAVWQLFSVGGGAVCRIAQARLPRANCVPSWHRQHDHRHRDGWLGFLGRLCVLAAPAADWRVAVGGDGIGGVTVFEGCLVLFI